jgi:hypothetical protein
LLCRDGCIVRELTAVCSRDAIHKGGRPSGSRERAPECSNEKVHKFIVAQEHSDLGTEHIPHTQDEEEGNGSTEKIE